MVPTLEVISRHINAGLLNDEPIRWFTAVDAVIVLSRAKIYGHTAEEHDKLQRAREAIEDLQRRSCSRGTKRLRRYVMHIEAGSDVGLRQRSELIYYLLSELLCIAPQMAAYAISFAEAWEEAHPTIGARGRLSAICEKALFKIQGRLVGISILGAMASEAKHERLTGAGSNLIQRRTLDLAILTLRVSALHGSVLPEPLSRSVRLQMEKLLSIPWHTMLLGLSAECRMFSVKSMGGAAVLAGEPFRICTYARLLELVRIGGLGFFVVAVRLFSCPDLVIATGFAGSPAPLAHKVARLFCGISVV